MIKGIYLNTDNEKNSKGIQRSQFHIHVHFLLILRIKVRKPTSKKTVLTQVIGRKPQICWTESFRPTIST